MLATNRVIYGRGILIATALFGALLMTGLDVRAQTPIPLGGTTGLANPASTYCIGKGDTLTLEKNAKGDQFGVCTFEDNRQCEEWALLRGDCPVGGLRVTGYVTPAARYCAITGGTYAVTSASGAAGEQGSCTFKAGVICDAAAYFDGTCTPRTARAATAVAARIEARFRCADGKSIVATFVNAATHSVELALSDGRKLDLPQTRSGSGARYANADESIVFWNTGNTAFIDEGGTTTYSDCSA